MGKLKNIYRLIFMLITCASVWPAHCFAQNFSAIKDKFESYGRNNLPEKLFVHTDRTTYFTGELIWFKVYSVDGIYNKPLGMSKVAYVDILDDKQNSVLQAKIELNKGSGQGSFFIPVTVANGNYKFRAYTSWMKNFDPAYYFEKTITIINPQVVPEPAIANNAANVDIQFFPEGGNLVSDIEGKLAVKATNAGGIGTNFKGAIVSANNDTVSRFKSLKFGMGHFMFTPFKNQNYRAVITFADGKSVIKPLPAPLNTGYSMQLTENSVGQINITVSSKSNPSDKVYMLVHTRQLIKVVKEAALSNGSADFTIEKKLLGDGISHITIFTNSGQPVCERLYFKRPTDNLFITATPDQNQYSCRKKVNISVDTKDRSGTALYANLSMSVYRVDDLQNADQDNILSYLWLQSDLRGKIESPGYYFENNNEADEAADNLMLTQGWRKFDWAGILNNNNAAIKFLPETYGHVVTAKIVTAANTPATGVVAYLSSPGKRVQLFAAKSDSAGRLLFNTKQFNSTEIILQPRRDSGYRLDIVSPFSEQYAQYPLPLFSVNSSMQQLMEARNLEMQVQNIYTGDSTKQFEQPLIDSSGFYKKPGNTYLLDNYTRFPTMEEVLREYVKEVNVIRQQNKFHIKILGEKSFLYDPMVLIDGVPVFDADKLMAVDPLLIKKMEVVPQRYFFGPTTMEGILSFSSYKGDLAGLEIDPHAVVIDYEGLQMHRVFYSPVYNDPNQVKNRLPDFRNLLFWSPTVTANSKNAVSFYSSDQEGDYIGLVEGISTNGQTGSKYFKFTVKK